MRWMLVTFVAAVWVSSAWGMYDGGTGTVEDPYFISTAEQFNTIGLHPEHWGDCFRLTNNIDISAFTGTQFNIIGNYSKKFTGLFDGNGHTISNFTYSNPNNVSNIGLFGYTYNATIINLGLKNVSVTSGGRFIGGLIGFQSYGTIKNCNAESNITAVGKYSRSIGGLVGYSTGIIENCYAISHVNGINIANNESDDIGGLIGFLSGTLKNSYVIGNVSGNGVDVDGIGGLVGSCGGEILNCYSASDVNSTGEDSDYIGGLVGSHLSGVIINCYSIGNVTACDNNIHVGGLAGYGVGGVINCFWDTQVSGITISAGGIGRTTNELMKKNNYIAWNTPSQNTWVIDDGNNYPHFVWQSKPGIPLSADILSDFISGEGTEETPYCINTPQQLNVIGLFPDEWNKNYCLDNNIDMINFSGTEYNRIGVYAIPFSGVFNGHGYVISNLTYSTPTMTHYVGLFGATNGATITNLGLKNIYLSSTGSDIGGLSGDHRNGNISSCNISGTVKGAFRVGGLVGLLYNSPITDCHTIVNIINTGPRTSIFGGMVGSSVKGIYNNCFTISDISGQGEHCTLIGGLLGESEYDIINYCYADVNISANGERNSLIGGLIGTHKYGTIYKCYATGNIACLVNFTNNTVGGLVGYLSGLVDRCYANCNVSGSNIIGGLVGGVELHGEILNSSAAGNVSGFDRVGGLAGKQIKCNISNCHAFGNINGNNYVGGLIGNLEEGAIENSHAIGDVSGNGFVGGLAGNTYLSSINACFATGNSMGVHDIGGLIGWQFESELSNCYALGNASGISAIGGLIGYIAGIDAHAEKCYSIGQTSGEEYTGGFLGQLDIGSTSACFWDIQTNGLSTPGYSVISGVTGLITTEMQTQRTFTDAGWDFVEETENGIEDIWYIHPQEYPRLACFPSLQIEEWVFVSQRRVSRTVYEYVYQLTLRNEGAQGCYDVEFALIKYPSNWNILDGSVRMDGIPVGAVVTAEDTVCFQVDRSIASDCDKLLWLINYGQSQDGMGMMATSKLPWPQKDSLSGDLSNDGIVNLEDLTMLAQSWLATGVNDADIAPGDGDGVVNLVDFTELVRQMEAN